MTKNEIIDIKKSAISFNPLLTENGLFITRDGSLSVLLKIDFSIKNLSSLLKTLRQGDSAQIYRICVHGSEQWYLCVTAKIDYDFKKLQLRKVLFNSYNNYLNLIQKKTLAAEEILGKYDGDCELDNPCNSLLVKILRGLGGANSITGVIRNVHNLNKSAELKNEMDQFLLCYKVFLPEIAQRRKMVELYTDRAAKMVNIGEESVAQVDTVAVNTDMNYLGPIFFTSCNWFLWNNSIERLHGSLNKLVSLCDRSELVTGISEVNKIDEYRSLFPGMTATGYDYDVVTKKYLDITLNLIGTM
ncbi:MAG: hypothetical protein GX640_04115 [Fibrobacter sp.]|nr:hypothetical protein [Fibrobacter sp.]